jgi:hypothetical protein
MVTNGIKHNLRVGQKVWSLKCTCGQEFMIEKITDKRIVCREIDSTGKGKRLATSNHCPSNLFVVEPTSKARIDSVIQ